jgi:hypothetical protein
METILTDEQQFSDLSPLQDRRRGSDRRREIRMASRSGPATLCVAARVPIEVQVKDVSRSGLGLTTPCPVLVGSNVVVVCGGLTINGTVRHCRERVSGEYAAGILINRIVDTGAGKEI